MVRYSLQRAVQAFLLLISVASVVFLLERLSGNPAQLLAPPFAKQAQITAISNSLGLNDPLYVQYGKFVSQLLRGDFGYSWSFNRPVRDLIVNAFPYTAQLAIAAFAFAFVAGITIGTLSALNSNGWLDNVFRFITVAGQSIPSFFLGMLLVAVFAIKLRMLPPFGSGGPEHLILPAVALSALPLSAITRMARSATLDVLHSDHLLFERSKGVSQYVLISHLLRNASLPVITLSAIQLGSLLGGSVVIETLFAWPGLGLLAIQGIDSRDYAIVQAVVLGETAIFVTLNLLVDLSYAWLDPRVRRT